MRLTENNLRILIRKIISEAQMSPEKSEDWFAEYRGVGGASRIIDKLKQIYSGFSSAANPNEAIKYIDEFRDLADSLLDGLVSYSARRAQEIIGGGYFDFWSYSKDPNTNFLFRPLLDWEEIPEEDMAAYEKAIKDLIQYLQPGIGRGRKSEFDMDIENMEDGFMEEDPYDPDFHYSGIPFRGKI